MNINIKTLIIDIFTLFDKLSSISYSIVSKAGHDVTCAMSHFYKFEKIVNPFRGVKPKTTNSTFSSKKDDDFCVLFPDK
jgi:hypothetical protein